MIEKNIKIINPGLSNVMRYGIFINISRVSPHYATPEKLTGLL